jgi:MFS family permease
LVRFPTSEAIRSSALGLAISGMLALALAMGVGRFAFTPILPMMQKDLGLTLRMAGLLASANYVGYFVGALSAIWLRATTARVLPVSMVTVALLTVAMGLTRNPVAWLLLRGLAGILSAWILVFASASILERLVSLGKSRLGGVMFGGVGFGIALTGAACLWFLHRSWAADQAWIALGAIALVLALACWPGFHNAMHARMQPRADAAPLSW